MYKELFIKPDGVGIVKWYFLLARRFFDTGLAITNYAKYVIAIFGFTSNDVEKTMFIAFGYGIFCFFLGWAWYYWKFVEIDNEISNRFNLFTREMRDMRKQIEK